MKISEGLLHSDPYRSTIGPVARHGRRGRGGTCVKKSVFYQSLIYIFE